MRITTNRLGYSDLGNSNEFNITLKRDTSNIALGMSIKPTPIEGEGICIETIETGSPADKAVENENLWNNTSIPIPVIVSGGSITNATNSSDAQRNSVWLNRNSLGYMVSGSGGESSGSDLETSRLLLQNECVLQRIVLVIRILVIRMNLILR